MTDELKKLQEALQAPPPKPADDVRERAMAAAMAAFDEKNSTARQGTGSEERHTGRISRFINTLFGRRSMSFANPTFRYALAGGASLAVIAVVLTNTMMLQPTTFDAVQAPIDELQVGTLSNEATQPVPTTAPARQEMADADTVIAQSTPGPAPVRREMSEADAVMAPTVAPAQAPMPEREAIGAGVRAKAMAEIGASGLMSMDEAIDDSYRDQGRDQFEDFETNPINVVTESPVSTFSIDVDTAAYGFMRASLNQGVLPQQDSVRVEELINYFPYDYAMPEDRDRPFAASVTLMQTPWNEKTQLMHIGIQGYSLQPAVRPKANLVFLIDSSGSMDAPNKLPLLINSFKLLLDTLGDEDTVSIVTYAGSAGVVLEPTAASERAKILASFERLQAGGSTAGAEGIRQAYLLAEQNKVEGGVNRVFLATDGDFNVGISDREELQSYIERKRDSGVFLSVLGFGMGNYNDALMQTLAQNGNGNAAYIDSLSEARKVLVEEATSTLFPIAKDVKIQVEFNPAMISEYRLIGYETRMLAREDFSNDKVDAGDIGAGHTVTAIYELTPVGSGAERVDPLRYQEEVEAPASEMSDEIGFLKIRYKLPDGDTSTLITRPVTADDRSDSVDAAPRESRFATAVAAFGQLLRGGQYTGDFDYDDIIALAQGAKGDDLFGYRAEFINLVRLAKSAAAMEPLRR